jgi:hypothetical protein
MKQIAAAVGVWGIIVFAGLGVPCSVDAHEPVFSPGPHTLYEGGISTSVGSSIASTGDGEPNIGLSAGAVYGLTADLNLAVGVPVAVSRQTHDGELTGVGDSVFQVKWRPWKSMAKGRIDALSLIGAVKLPTGHHDLSRGNTGFVVGATAAREHQRYYVFGSVRYTTQTVGTGGVKPGDVFQYDVATGVRPFILEYDQPDAVVLVELNGRTSRPSQGISGGSGGTEQSHHGLSDATARYDTRRQGQYRTRRQAHTAGAVDFASAGTGGTELAVSPELLLSWGPVMLKGGIQFPFFDTFENPAATPNYRIQSSLIVQF